MLFQILSFLLATTVIHGQQITEECPGTPGWSKFEGSCYKVFTADMNFTMAQDICTLMNSSVVSIRSAEENDFVARLCYDDYKLCQRTLNPLPKWNHTGWSNGGLDEFFCKKQDNDYMDSYFIGLHRKINNGTGRYENHWEDNSTTTFGNLPEALMGPPAPGTNPKFPWHHGQPSGYNNYTEAPGSYPEECTSMVDPCGQWNDLKCADRAAGVVCEKKSP